MFLYSLNWLFPLLLKDSLFSLVFFSRLLSWTKNKLHTLTNYIFIIHIFLLKAYFYSKHNCVFIDDKIEKRATHFPVLVLYIDRYISSSIIVCSNNNNNNTEIYKTYESCFFFFLIRAVFLNLLAQWTLFTICPNVTPAFPRLSAWKATFQTICMYYWKS